VPRKIACVTLLILIISGLFGGRSLVANTGGEAVHLVKPGETLMDVSRSVGVPVEQLMALNNLTDPDVVLAGQALTLPVPASQGTSELVASAIAREYVVRAGDTLSGIAKSLGVSMRSLVDTNQLADPNRVLVGQRLKMPEGAATTQSVAARAATTSDGPSTTLLERLAEAYDVDVALVEAMAWQENGGKPLPLSDPRALGLLQVTGAAFDHVEQSIVKRQLDRARVEDNAEAGVAYIATLVRWAGAGGDAKALAAFIQGPGSIQANGVRPATEQLVTAILALRDQLKQPGRVSQPARAAASPTPGPAGSLSDRAIAAARAVAGPNGRIGVAGRDLVSGQRLALAANESFPAASVAKLWILAEVYRQNNVGLRPMTDALRSDLNRMISISDNDVANRLLSEIGIRNVNNAMDALGLHGSQFSNRFGTARPPDGVINRTTPSDMLHFLELLATDQAISPSASRDMRALLFLAADTSKIQSGLPEGARLAHKSGWFTGVANDVGIVYHGRSSYGLAVLTEGIDNPDTANDTIAAIARTVHASWGPK
jgi:beta-lactamase class A/LysM repeat protein